MRPAARSALESSGRRTSSRVQCDAFSASPACGLPPLQAGAEKERGGHHAVDLVEPLAVLPDLVPPPDVLQGGPVQVLRRRASTPSETHLPAPTTRLSEETWTAAVHQYIARTDSAPP